MNAKILLLDIETAPAKVFCWGLFDQNIGTNQIVEDGYVLCWCAKWLGDREIKSDALVNYPSYYTQNPRSDKKIAESIWQLIGEADIVVTHNGNDFDLKWLNTIFIKNGLKPQCGYRSVDTFLEVKKKFRFISNKLDFICRKLSLGRKISTGGFELWDECMRGVRLAWRKLVKYCKHDVLLLEKLYLTLRPFMAHHPNLGLYEDRPIMCCPNCSSKHYRKRGFEYTLSAKYRRYSCYDCGKCFSDRTDRVGKVTTKGI